MTHQSVTGVRPTPAPRKYNFARRENLYGYLFISPWLIGFFLLTLGPGLASMALSFTKYNILRPPQFLGVDNYVYALTKDKLFYPSILRTFYYAVLSVPLGVLGSMFLAILLNTGVKGITVFRTFFYVPSLVPIMAAAILFGWLLHPDFGPVNAAIRGLFNVAAPGWFSDRRYALPSLVLMSLWLSVGGTRMIIFLAGLQGIPQELYEAASIDGANAWHRTRHITIPLLSPTIFFNVILGVIGALQVFTSAFVTTSGGPAYATYFIGLHIYYQAFDYLSMGYACTLAWLFAVVIVTLTLIQQRFSGRWVFYYGG
ncbi:MAG: sugar ABC transporter permease [Chloroflexi bacterium]|jgi:multiple sugar transport system permease protein|nr:sugar ABC transporter permease [Chloroflexota bacterium]